MLTIMIFTAKLSIMSSQLSIIAEINIDFDVSFDKPYHSEDKWNHKLSNISGNYLIPHVSDVKKLFIQKIDSVCF